MEFPHLGQNCSETSCNRLDFLPMKCDSCNKDFCSSHFNYEGHGCTGPRRKDMQVPICPLCGEPVPTAPGIEPDVTVGRHIDQQCKSDTHKIYTNRCSYKNCKKKELIPVTCSECRKNYCLRHRHIADHECSTISNKFSVNNGSMEQRAFAANSAEYRRTNKSTSIFNMQPNRTAGHKESAVARPSGANTNVQIQAIQGSMSEDEALARALALSVMEFDESAESERRSEPSANAAIQRNTVQVGGRDGQTTNGKDKCMLC